MCHLVGFVKRYALHRFFLCPKKTVVVSTIFTIVKKFVVVLRYHLLTVIESLKVTKIYSEVSSNICLLSLDYQDMFADSNVFVHTSFDVLIAVVSLNSCAVRYCGVVMCLLAVHNACTFV